MKERNEKQEKEKIPKRGLEINREEKNKRGEDNSKPENKKKPSESSSRMTYTYLLYSSLESY